MCFGIFKRKIKHVCAWTFAPNEELEIKKNVKKEKKKKLIKDIVYKKYQDLNFINPQKERGTKRFEWNQMRLLCNSMILKYIGCVGNNDMCACEFFCVLSLLPSLCRDYYQRCAF